MVDIHCHLVFGVDDGPSEIKESMRMVLEAEKLGVKAIIATPHFHEGLYSDEKVDEHFDMLVSRTAGCGVDLYKGYEIFMTPALGSAIKKKESLLLGGSRHALFELPFDILPSYITDVLYTLHLNKIVPIIAHPERNRYFARNFNGFVEFLENGCLVQLDSASIVGVYGAEVRNFARKLIKLNLPHFIASDAHCADDFTRWYPAAYDTVKHWAGEEYADKLFKINPGMIISSPGEQRR
jgi:protein-tyrosine phosphatase